MDRVSAGKNKINWIHVRCLFVGLGCARAFTAEKEIHWRGCCWFYFFFFFYFSPSFVFKTLHAMWLWLWLSYCFMNVPFYFEQGRPVGICYMRLLLSPSSSVMVCESERGRKRHHGEATWSQSRELRRAHTHTLMDTEKPNRSTPYDRTVDGNANERE